LKKKLRNDERRELGAVDDISSEEQIHVSDNHIYIDCEEKLES